MRKTHVEKGISPAIAAIMLIALTVVAVGSIAAFLGLLSPGTPSKSVSITVDSYTANSVTFFHGGGDDLDQADLKFTLNGAEMGTIPAGTFSAGEKLIVSALAGVSAGDTVSLVYRPPGQTTGQVLVNTTLS